MKPVLPFPIPKVPEIEFQKLGKNVEILLNLAYAEIVSEHKLDLLIPKNSKVECPLVIYIHEGAFAFGSKRDKRISSILPLLDKGFAIATIEYRKSNACTWPAQIFDAKAAVRFLRANAKKYRLDGKRFAVIGASAGAYIGSMLGVTAGIPAFEDFSMGNPGISSEVQAVVDCFGCCGGFHLMDEQILQNGFGRANHSMHNSPESIMMGNALDDIRELCQLAAPISYVHKTMPPFLIQHGLYDPVTPLQQSEDFAKAIQKAAGEDKVQFSVYEAEHNNLSIYDMEEAQAETIEFLERVFQIGEECV